MVVNKKGKCVHGKFLLHLVKFEPARDGAGILELGFRVLKVGFEVRDVSTCLGRSNETCAEWREMRRGIWRKRGHRYCHADLTQARTSVHT